MDNTYKFLAQGIVLSIITLLLPAIGKEVTNSTPVWNMFLLAYSLSILYITILIFNHTLRLAKANAVKTNTTFVKN
ncbi:hypothetical protein CAP35_04040 [Chitinophagaceae bacterium IBVUCB1]|nr:hypothetical protein CAP35_04040 [Chitinophagaceae bacterium IBVUCB1]